GKLRSEKQRLIRGNDGVSPEHRCEPGNPRSDHVLVSFRNLQRMKVAFAGPYHFVKNLVTGIEVGGPRFPVRIGLAALTKLLHEIRLAGAGMLPLHHRNHIHLQVKALKWRESQSPAGDRRLEALWLGAEADKSISCHTVQPD